MTLREHYFSVHSEYFASDGGDGLYPMTSDGYCLCTKKAGYNVEECNIGEGFYDCRDCWNREYIEK